MTEVRILQTVEQAYSGRLATVSEDGFPYCVPLLYVWMDGELYLHTTSVRGHLRSNIDRDPRVCFEIDEQQGVFDYGRFECDSGLAFRSVCLFGRIIGIAVWMTLLQIRFPLSGHLRHRDTKRQIEQAITTY